MATEKAIATLLAYFHELYPTREITESTPEAWRWALTDVSDARLQDAMQRIVREPGRTFFPTPNELRQHLPAIRAQGALQETDPVALAIDKAYSQREKVSQRLLRAD